MKKIKFFAFSLLISSAATASEIIIHCRESSQLTFDAVEVSKSLRVYKYEASIGLGDRVFRKDNQKWVELCKVSVAEYEYENLTRKMRIEQGVVSANSYSCNAQVEDFHSDGKVEKYSQRIYIDFDVPYKTVSYRKSDKVTLHEKYKDVLYECVK